MPRSADFAPPRLGRAVLLQALLLVGAAVISELPFLHRARPPEPAARREPPPKPPEKQIRVVVLPKEPPPAPRAPPPAPPKEAPPTKQAVASKELPKQAPKEVPKELPKQPPKQPPKETPKAIASPEPAPEEEVAPPPTAVASRPPPSPTPPTPQPGPRAPVHIAADSTSVQGVRLRVLVPRLPEELAAHLRNSGGCLVVSRLQGESAEVLSVLGFAGGRAVEVDEAPCGGVPRLLRDPSLNQSLGDPLGRTRASHPGDELALQVLLTPQLPALAQAALRARFGPVSAAEMAQRAADAGYQLTCYAEPEGPVRCQ